MARNSELHSYWKESVIQSLRYLKDQTKEGKGPDEIIAQEIVLDERGFPSIRYVRKLLLDFFVLRSLDAIGKLPVVQSLLNYMQGSQLVNKHYRTLITVHDSNGTVIKEPDLRPYLIEDPIITFLRKYVEAEPSLDFDEMKFDKIYTEFEDYVSGELIRHYYALLPWFSMDVESLELFSGVVIRRRTSREFNRVLGMGQYPEFSLAGSIPPRDVYWSPFVAEATFRQSEQVEPRFTDLIDALRLFKSGAVGISGIFRESEVEWGTGFSSVILPDRRANLLGGRYRLEENEVASFKIFHENFSKLLPKVKKLEFVDLAIRRFVVAIEEILPEDRVIDFMISLESLFSKEIQELSYHLALRLSSLIGTNDANREYLFEFVKKAYDRARSRLVHGGAYNQPIVIGERKFTINELATELEKLTRLSIRVFLNLIGNYYNNKEGIIQDLDKSIVSSAARDQIGGRAKGAFN
ncbi:MAG: HEPN domain-containing protein [Thaumarchaeota archaeon]|nr:HEPN domain-containing protein [Nitrososphaerota archaeon]